MKFELTSSQKTFYVKNGNIDDKIWNQGMIQKFNKVYDYELLNAAFNDLVRNNESLLVKFSESTADGIMQLYDFEYTYYPFLNLSSDEELEIELHKFLNEAIDLSGDLFRCIIFQTPTSSGLLINTHHIVVDGFSGIVVAEHINNYLKNPEYVHPVTQKYHEYIEKENKYKSSKRFQKAKEFWIKQFSDDPMCKVIPKEDASYKYASDITDYDFSADFFEKISGFCKTNNISVPSFFYLLFSVYFHRINDINNFTIGTPVLNRTTQAELNTVGLYMHILPLVINLTDELFIENAHQLEDSHLNLFRHQSFAQHDIKDLLKETKGEAGALFDVAIDYEELPKSEDYDIDICYSNALSLSLEIHVFNMADKKKLKIRYRTSMFTEREIRMMINSVIALAEDALEHPDKKISELNMISADEQELLNSFNETQIPYDKNKCIYEVFEEQASKHPERTAVIFKDTSIKYKELTELVDRYASKLSSLGVEKEDVVAIHLERSHMLIVLQLAVIKIGAVFMPLDKRYPENRIEYACKDCSVKILVTDERLSLAGLSVITVEEFDTIKPTVTAEEVINKGPCYIIYTSGSTGKPKGCLLTGQGLLNFCKNNNTLKSLDEIKECTFACVNSVSFDYFIAESLLPLTNGFTTVIMDDKESTDQKSFLYAVEKNRINVVMTTPTRLKIYFSDKIKTDALSQLRCICTSGEPLTPDLLKQMYEKSPKAKVYNPIGPSECSVWDIGGELYREDGIDIHIGKPIANAQIYIVDKYMNLVPIGVTGEICIGGDGVGAGYINNPELTAEKFIDNPFGEGKLYRTGDNAYWREDGNIVYVGRSDFQVKIRGLRVELGEIESALQNIEGIDRAVVVVRKNSEARQFICAFYTGEERSAKELRAEMGESLPKYMLPHIFTNLEEIPLTANGKANRNALPEIDLENISTDTEYVAPETERESILIECIEKVLNNEKTSVLDNFFDIGGDSLKAIELIAMLEEKGYEVSVKAVFSSENIRALANELKEKKAEFVNAEYGSVIPATPAQLRIYTAQMFAPQLPLYNVTYAFKSRNTDKQRLESAINSLIARHESLRTHFENRNGEIYQVIDEKASITVECIATIEEFSKAFNLERSPLIRVGCNDDTVVIDIHHIAVDGETLPTLFRELNELYMGRVLPEKVVQYGEFAVTSKYDEENEKYWLDVFDEVVSDVELPKDYQRSAVQSFNGNINYKFIGKALHEKIELKCKEIGITPFVYYMACLSVLLFKLSGSEDIVIGTPISGRTSRFLGTVGMFVNTVALRSKPEGDKRIFELLSEIKDASVSAIDNQNYPFGNLVKKLGIDTSGRNPMFDVMLAYQSFEMTDITFADEKIELLPLSTTVAKCDMTFNILPRKADVVLAVEYCTDLYKRERIEKFTSMYVSLLELCLDDRKLIKDISVIDEAEKQLLDSFNNTSVKYKEDTSVYHLFKEQAEKNPERTAVVFKEKHLSYNELSNLVDMYADNLKYLGIKANDVVALHLERSHMLIALQLAVLKIGAIFMPLDKRYPEDRIKYACNDCSVKILITDEGLSFVGITIINIEQLDAIKTTCIAEAVVNKGPCYIIYTSGSTGKPKGCLLNGKGLLNFCKNNNTLKTLREIDYCVFGCVNSVSFDYFIAESLLPLTNGFTTVVLDDNESTNQKLFADAVINNGINVIMTTPTRLKIYFNDKIKTDALLKFRCICTSGEPLTSDLLSQMYEKSPLAKVYNPIGPSECSVWDIGGELFREDGIDIHIGKPIANAQIHIVDKYMNLVPVGVTGEICIGGDGVGAGYANNPELTAERFVNNPFGEGKLYKTGDLAYWREDGNIVFVGRNDFQVKIRGLRIELGEIENTVSSVNGIELSVAVVRTDKNGTQYICVFYTGEEKTSSEIKSVIRGKLPSYMMPNVFKHLEEMPLTSSGKINRKALPNVDFVKESDFEIPINEKEQFVCDAFSKVLDVKNVGRNSDFFELGGTSLSMISLLSENGFEGVTAAEFMRNSTPGELSAAMSCKEKADFNYLEPLHMAEGSKKALVLLPFGGGGAEGFGKLVNEIKAKHNDVSVYFIRYLHSASECERAAEEIERIFHGYEVSFYSHCAGAALAMKILVKLEYNNFKVKHYYAGAIIPVATTGGKNTWNRLPDFMVKSFLAKSGADFGDISGSMQKEIFTRFRKDTDYANKVFYESNRKFATPVTVIISKKDFFTRNYKQAEKQWTKYAENLQSVKFIDTKSHYFQTHNAEEVAEIIFG